MATKKQVINLHAKYPKLTCQAIAKKLGCIDAYVRKTFYRDNISFVHGKVGRPRKVT